MRQNQIFKRIAALADLKTLVEPKERKRVSQDSMGLVRRVLADVITPNRGIFLSFGILGSLWAASGGFSAAIEALNLAYEVNDDRPFWKTRPLALAARGGSSFVTAPRTGQQW